MKENHLTFIMLGDIESENSGVLHKFIKKRFFIKQLKEIKENGGENEEENKNSNNPKEQMNSVEIRGETIKMKIWDQTSASKLFSSSNKILKVAKGILLFYSVGDRKTFNMLKLSLYNLVDFDQYDIPMVMVGNDSDTPKRQVTYEEAKSLADSYGIKFYETNIAYNFDDIFEDLDEPISNVDNNPDNVAMKIKSFFRHSIVGYKSKKKAKKNVSVNSNEVDKNKKKIFL